MSKRPTSTNHLLAALTILRIIFFLIFQIIWFILRSIGRDRVTTERRAASQGISFGRGALKILGIKLTTSGPTPPSPALLAPNHMGYLDIVAMMGVTECFFLARAEIAQWPLLGRVVVASGHPVIKRSRNRALASAGEAATVVLGRGDRLCIFLEGTSTGHDRVLPFHPSMIQPAINTGVPVVPVGIRWKSTNPRIDLAEDACYWKDHVIGPHLWKLAGLRGLEVEVVFGEPISSEGRGRKSLAADLRGAVAEISGLLAIDQRGWIPPEKELNTN